MRECSVFRERRQGIKIYLRKKVIKNYFKVRSSRKAKWGTKQIREKWMKEIKISMEIEIVIKAKTEIEINMPCSEVRNKDKDKTT